MYQIGNAGLVAQKAFQTFAFGTVKREFRDGSIVTSDGGGDDRALPIQTLRRVVVATDDSGPWGADLVFLLYSNDPEPACLFPLEANGRGDFVKWLAAQPGYRERDLEKAMGSTAVARFEVLVVEPNGS
ncbi:hypothetical protein [Sphingomonas sp.]|uniref:hypothetical protein n=1 Tax=Sphingomonas sp. TaxID=28214 RepID=UPI003B00A81E